jgi:hypothetical protein
MQNKEELRQKEHNRSRKMTHREGGKISYWKGGGGNIVFEPKYKPMYGSNFKI